MSKARLAVLALSVVGLVIACSGGDNAATTGPVNDAGFEGDSAAATGTPPDDAASDAPIYLTLSAACDALAQAELSFARACGGLSTDATPYAAQCRNEGSAAGTGQTIATVLACAASFTTRTSCNVTTVDPSCKPAGTTASGGGCSFDTQCADGACATPTYGSCGTCTTPALVGEDCSGHSCASSLRCFGAYPSKCRAQVPDGGACNATDAPCATGGCVHGVCTAYSGVGPAVTDDTGNRLPCAPGANFINYGYPACVLPAPKGGACDLSSTTDGTYQTCALGLYCASAPTDGGAKIPGKCVKPGAIGAACDHQRYGGYLPVPLAPLPSACVAGAVCTATTSTSGACIAKPAVGSPCPGLGDCGDHQRCITDRAHPNGTCQAAGTVGNVCIYYLACDAGLVCDSTHSLDGTCALAPAAGSPCIAGRCAAGNACNTSTGTCVALATAGQSCTVATCSADTYCDASAPGGAICRTLAVIGDPCDDPTDRRYCPTRAYCQHADGGTTGTCAALPGVGDACGYSASLQTSNTCADSVGCLPAGDAGTAYACAYACGP